MLVGQAHAGSADRAQAPCYRQLTELVRSSSFPFARKGVKKEQADLVIDEDDGKQVFARVFFHTDGTGTLGWIRYDVSNRELLDESAELESPTPLIFDSKYAEQYERCLRAR